MLEARGMRKTYRTGRGATGEHVAVAGLDFTVDDDVPRFTTIAGESGSGKTTIARLLLGIQTPSSGRVLYRGRDLLRLSRAEQRAFRGDVQAIFQDPFEVYNPFYKVDHMLTTPIRKFRLARGRAQARERMETALRTVGLRPEETLGRYPHQLSGGQRQRITIARALLVRPKLIVADEPVSMVDASLRATIIDSLYRLYRDMGISFVYITHDLTTAYQVSDELIVLYRGMIVEAGDAETVIRAPSHPYARELIRAIPSTETGTDWISGPAREADAVAAGPAIVKADAGCPYADRCPDVMERCRRERPELLQRSPDVRTACFLYDTQPHD